MSDQEEDEVSENFPTVTVRVIPEQTIIWNDYFDLHTNRGQILFVILIILISCLIPILLNNGINFSNYICYKIEDDQQFMKHLKYAIYNKSPRDHHLRHVHLVLKRLGYKQTKYSSDWDLLWAHEYPFRVLSDPLRNIQSYQKINHFPGCGYITNKVDLCTSNLPYIPKGFKLPEEKKKFLEYTRIYPNKLFVQKHNQHRHIYIKQIDEIDFNSNDTFLQEFIDNPYLVDGYKFDIGVYVIITSVDPLRVYIYQGDVLFRYCPKKYYPFDSKNINKYIVGDDYLPTWDVPSLKQYYNDLNFGMKDSFDAYVKSKQQNPKIIWQQVEDAIRIAIQKNEKHIVDILNVRYPKLKRNFFEMMRFDLVINNNLKVYLMEANMSPNLSSAHFKQNTLLYEQVIYSLLNLVGIGSSVQRGSLRKLSTETEEMISSYKNIMVAPEICSNAPCTMPNVQSCAQPECHICRFCLKKDDIQILHAAFREHIHKTDTKRIVPARIKNPKSYNLTKEIQNLSPKNQMMVRWFYGKCKIDNSWC